MPKSPATVAPRLTRATFTNPVTTRELPVGAIETEGSYDGVAFSPLVAGVAAYPEDAAYTGSAASAAAADPALDAALCSFLDCTFADLDAARTTLDAAHLQHCLWRACNLTQLTAVRAGVAETRFDGVRIGALEAMDASLTSLAFEHCRIGYLNLRGAIARDVTFTDCLIDEFDATDARLQRVAFPTTRIGTLTCSTPT
ncbi:MAG: hypothetical protein UHD09_06335 [Bifidobacterium sp.]|nr:hypothetical protein [Bifidobacterium sp.]